MDETGNIRSLSYLAAVILALGYIGTEADSCVPPTVLSNGSINVDADVTTARFFCNSGFELIGASLITCNASSGLWSDTVPTCSIKDCGALSDENGVWSYNSTTYGSAAQIVCNAGYTVRNANTGYYMLSNIPDVWCTSSYYNYEAYWSRDLYCTQFTCGALSDTNGVWSYNTTTYGSVAQIACNSGYTVRNSHTGYYLESNITSVSCTCFQRKSYECEPGWSKDVFCSRIKCPALYLYNGNEIYNSRSINYTVTYYCYTGYEMTSGDATRICLYTGCWEGSWNGTQPVCTKLSCGPLTAPVDGTVSASLTTYGSWAEYYCNTGYTRVGDRWRQCSSSGLWSGTAPICQIVDCGSLAAPSNGSVNLTLTTYNEYAVFSCDIGFIINGASDLRCMSTGYWSSVAPTCDIIDCGVLPNISYGSYNVSTTTYGQQVVYICETGYNMSSGDATRTCQVSGLWNGTQPVCSILDCGPPTAPMNGLVSAPVTTYGDKAVHQCDAGYIMQGSTIRTCNNSGQWSGTIPKCHFINCDSLLAPNNGSFDLTVYNSTVHALFTCDMGFYSIGSTIITCTPSNVWDAPPPTCDLVDCGHLAAPMDGSVSTPGGTVYPEVAYYVCDKGYEMSGPSTRVCQTDGAWNGTSPKCWITDCGVPPPVANGNASYMLTTYGAIVEYSCYPGFELNGGFAMSCTASGQWNDTNPSCDMTACHAQRTPPTTVHYQTVTSPLPGFTLISTSGSTSSTLRCIATCNAHARDNCGTGVACGLVTYDDVTTECSRWYPDPVNGTIVGCNGMSVCYRK